MTKIETTVEIGADRRLSIQLPSEVAEGRHEVVVLLVESDRENGLQQSEADVRTGALEWEGNLLVCNQPIPAELDIRRLIEIDRQDRMLHTIFGGT